MTEKDEKSFFISDDYSGLRADVAFSSFLSDVSRSQIRKYIKEEFILIDGKPFKPSRLLSGGESVTLKIPEPLPIEALPEKIDIDFLFEDSDIAVVNKRAGMIVHPGAGVKTGTLVNALLYRCKDLSGIGGKIRPGIVHRLDKETSGVMVIAKNDFSHSSLVDQFKNRLVKKEYIAIVRGVPKTKSGTYQSYIGRDKVNRLKISSNTKSGRIAITSWEVVERFTEATLIKARLETGRTHQIRVHFSENGHPVLCDKIYGKKSANKKLSQTKKVLKRQALHSHKIGFTHPRSNEFVEFLSPIPDDMKSATELIDN